MTYHGGGNDHRLTDRGFAFGSSHRILKIVIRDGISFVGICLSVAALGALGYQCLVWVSYGVWRPLAFRLMLELVGAQEPLFGSQSVEKISGWIFDLPLTGVLLGVGVVTVMFGVAITAGGGRPFGAAEVDSAASLPGAAEIWPFGRQPPQSHSSPRRP